MDEKEKIIQEIETSFKGVQLANGIGLSEANAMDNYAEQSEQAKCRSHDEKEAWQNIPSSALNQNHCSLSYFDPEGMRFHLPAFVIADLKGEYTFDIVRYLVHLSDHVKTQMSQLNNEQHLAIRSFLLYALDQEELDKEIIQSALDNYWRKK